ncbi:MAG: hypothetical protein QNJ55_35580 [Xenococcus sp. MO_188.B8]|nr:hypothetical protein [Xenococcus sp. MO_188.B8]
MMIETRQPVRDAEDLQGAWLKTRERFGALVEAETLKNLASEGFQEFGRGVVCLTLQHGQPCSFYLPSDRLLLVVKEPEQLWPLFSRLKSYQPEKSEIIVLVTFSDLEIEQISPYQYFYLSVS